MTTATRKASGKQRSIGIVATEGHWLLIELFDGKRLDFYLARQFPTDFGTGFLLEKQDASGTAETYRTNIGDARHYPECDCKGHSYRGHCKHAEGLKALLKAGRLPVCRATCPIHGTDACVCDNTPEESFEPESDLPPDTFSDPCFVELDRDFRPGFDD